MKNTKQLNKKLTLNKKTISNLDIYELNSAKGGATLLCDTGNCIPTATVSVCAGGVCQTESCTWNEWSINGMSRLTLATMADRSTGGNSTK